MSATSRPPRIAPSPVGRLLQHWRHVRQKSQLAVALDAEISSRHLSFVESGRARPSQDMVLRLADALDVPLREQNDLLLAAGYAPIFRETDLDAPEMSWARAALELMLNQQEPYPAVVMDRRWNILMANGAAPRFFGRFVDLGALPEPVNVIQLMFDPEGLRPFVANWEPVAEALIQRIYREAVGGVPDEETARLLAEILADPDTPRRWRTPNLAARPAPLVPVQFHHGDLRMSFFSTVTTLGTPQDITLQEIRIESFFPADEETQAATQRLAGGSRALAWRCHPEERGISAHCRVRPWSTRFLAAAAMKIPDMAAYVREAGFHASVAPHRGMTTRNDTIAETQDRTAPCEAGNSVLIARGRQVLMHGLHDD